jgi:phosphatidate cytidylyltransferase
MLKQRVITALLLLAVLLPALFYPSPEPFCALTLLLIVGAGWEWGRLNGCGPAAAVGMGVLLGAVLSLAWWRLGLESSPPWLWHISGAAWVLVSVVLLSRGVPGWVTVPKGLRLWLGWGLIGLAWWAMAQARYIGTGMLLSIFVLVWMADIAAYFGGKAFGRRKLAPNISPGKSWAGVYSGGLGVLLLAAVWVWVERHWGWSGASLYGRLWAMGPGVAFLSLVFLTTMSVTGDLLESLVKRSAGVKDSSGLLPGHGGVLDRVDALLPVLPLAMMLVSL